MSTKSHLKIITAMTDQDKRNNVEHRKRVKANVEEIFCRLYCIRQKSRKRLRFIWMTTDDAFVGRNTEQQKLVNSIFRTSSPNLQHL
ncbi:uncharacterized protein LOC143246582 isoform X2 [Tachypleus tridentatus]|uniref:uncharacterized protein LOC143246582 isoform X2 n=2 Tax=Tachypleus tridentatus TaxID=6853 RepID=UPI003FD020BC